LSDEDLLRPTLADYQRLPGRVPGLYNSTGFFLTSFFGGPLGAAIYGGANSRRLGQLPKDLPLLVVVVAAAFLLPYVLHETGWLQGVAASMGGSAARNYGLFMRGLGLLVFGAIYLMHRQFFRSARVSGVTEVKGWVPGIAGLVAGIAANAAFVTWLLKHH
jgi:hypothetical protein